MTGRNANIYFPEETYLKLKQAVGLRISRFVTEAVEEKLKKQKENQKEQLKNRLIEAYKREAKSREVQEEMTIWEGVASDILDDKK